MSVLLSIISNLYPRAIRTIFLFAGFSLIFCIQANSREIVKNRPAREDAFTIVCTADLTDLVTHWTNEYSRLNPGLRIKVINVSKPAIAKALLQNKNLGFISNEYSPVLNGEAFWKMEVGRSMVVSIINSGNPYLNDIYQQGITARKFAQIFKHPELLNWGTLLNNGQDTPVNFYILNDRSTNESVAKFLKVNPGTLKGIKAENGKELISSVQKDPFALGFCKIATILEADNQRNLANITLLPLEIWKGKTNNENLYDNLISLSQGIYDAKYPKALYSNIYFVSSKKPTNENEVAFLKWVLTGGQKYLNYTGYSDLVLRNKRANIDMLNNHFINVNTVNVRYTILKKALIILFASILIVFLVNTVIRFIKKPGNAIETNIASEIPTFIDDNAILTLKGLYYDKTHTWVFLKKDGMAIVGIDDFLQHVTGPITRIKMPDIGKKVRKGEQILSIIQNGKQLNIYAPISGTIKAQNKILNTEPSLVNFCPLTDGWMFIIEPTNWLTEIQFLIMEKQYKEWLKSEFTRLKDFFSMNNNTHGNPEYAYSVLQDGGALRDGVLADFGPEVWEDFQTCYLDRSG
ncbi:MAG: hypothetical protein GXO83_10735 [Chlorobi bacterium]|nr:hypothetical protein [Chlorobiota bacterium]